MKTIVGYLVDGIIIRLITAHTDVSVFPSPLPPIAGRRRSGIGVTAAGVTTAAVWACSSRYLSFGGEVLRQVVPNRGTASTQFNQEAAECLLGCLQNHGMQLDIVDAC